MYLHKCDFLRASDLFEFTAILLCVCGNLLQFGAEVQDLSSLGTQRTLTGCSDRLWYNS